MKKEIIVLVCMGSCLIAMAQSKPRGANTLQLVPTAKETLKHDKTKIPKPLVRGFDPVNLVYKVIQAESAGNPKAVSPRGAKGLMQLMDATALEVCKELKISKYKPFDRSQNIRIGTYYLGKLYRQYDKNIVLALVAYNWGPGNLNRVIARYQTKDYFEIKKYIPTETKNYVSRIMGV